MRLEPLPPQVAKLLPEHVVVLARMVEAAERVRLPVEPIEERFEREVGQTVWQALGFTEPADQD